MRQFGILENFDWPLFSSVLLLVVVGLIVLWSLSPDHLFLRQILWALIGLAALGLFAILDYRIFRNHGGILIILLLLGVALLTLLLLIGPKTRGVTSWFWLGSVAFEPVESIKLLLILILAKYFSRRHIEIYQIRHLLISGMYVVFPVALVILQPDLGSAIILLAIWVAVVIFSGIKLRHLFMTVLVLAAILGVFWIGVLEPYQKSRIVAYFDPYRDPLGAGYNAIQAVIAVGSGKIWGKGIGYGTQSQLNFLPEAETDFIFAALAEEAGLLGGIILFAIFSFFIHRVLKIGMAAKDNFSKLYVLGFSALVSMQFIIHVGINLALLPVTGITLPFVSYGGSSLVTLMAGVGILESIRRHSRSDIME